MKVFQETPHTTFVTISRSGAAWANQMAVMQFFGEQAPLAVLPGDPEANPENYDGTRQMRWEPLALPIYVGLRVTFTKNINKHVDYVNGMSAQVEGMYSSGVRVRTDTHHIVVVYPWTDDQRHTFFPIRAGYATTLLKVQGATLNHMTMYLDRANVEAAGYVALSRVQYDKDRKNTINSKTMV